MAHNLSARGSASIDIYGGLVTFSAPRDLPEGASPRSFDTDYLVGSVVTRPGLASVYGYANVLTITQVIITGTGSPEIQTTGTFSYKGQTTPTVNEAFLLSAFSAGASFLNGQTVLVLSVDTTHGTFTATVTGPSGSYLLQNGTATSSTGLFIGPNVPTKATDVVSGTPWANPNNILGNAGYASTTAGLGSQALSTGIGANTSSGSSSVPAWGSPTSIFGGSVFAFVTLNKNSSQLHSVPLLATPSGYSIPDSASIAGIAVTMNAAATYSATASGSFTKGPSVGAGAGWANPNDVTVNNGSLASFVIASGPDIGNAIVGSNFGFSIPGTATITGIYVSVLKKAQNSPRLSVMDAGVYLHSTATSSTDLSNNNLWPTASAARSSYGGSTNLWGAAWTPALINSSAFSFEIAGQSEGPGTGSCTTEVGYMSVTVYYSNGGVSGNATATVQLALNGAAVGVTATDFLTPSLAPFSVGNSGYLWGTTFAASDIANLGVLVTANAGSTFGTGTNYVIEANSLTATVYYTTDQSDVLQSTQYIFSVPATAGITGLKPTFQAYSSSGNATLTVQLLQNGVPVGNPKTQALTSTPTVYELGAGNDPWGTSWLFSDINSLGFGVQFTAVGTDTTFLNDVDMLVYITPGLSNFNYIKSYIQNNDQIYTLALDSSGVMWQEDVTSNTGLLSAVLTGILPNSFAKSATMDNREHIVFSDLNVGGDRPRVFDGTNFYPLSQIGPGAPPSIASSLISSGSPLVVTAYSIAAGVVTFTFTAQASFVPTVGSLYTITGTGNSNLDTFTFSVLGTPAPTTTTFAAATTTATGSGSGLTASALPTNTYKITSIEQDNTLPNPLPSGNAEEFFGQVQLWSAGPGQTTPGYTITCYYSHVDYAENAGLLNSFAKGYPVYVYITGAPIGNGTQLVTGHGIGIPPSETGKVPYFTIQATTSNFQRYGGPGGTGPNGPGNTGTFQLTLATLTTSTPVINLEAGAQVQVSGASPSAWNNTWTITDSLLNGQYNITSSQMLTGGVAQFQYSNASSTGAATVSNGQIIELSDLDNNVLFNTTGVVSNATGSTFQIAGFPGTLAAQANPVPENGQAVTFGTEFLFDPGLTYVGTASPSSIFGDTSTTPGTVAVIGGSPITIGAGIRQGVCFFITDNEYETQASAPFTFTTTESTNKIVVSQIPIGPANVVARGFAFTEAGQNGVAGGNFYVIEDPVTTVVNGVSSTSTSTIILDNTSTEASFVFSDTVLLTSREIDVQGDNLFNLIELGSSAWCVPYAGRMFYGLQLNKIDNWTSGGGLTFDGGYIPNPAGNIQPCGWNIVNPVDQTLLNSPVVGQALYIKNQNLTVATVGMIYQTAFQDSYLVPIIAPNTTYSVRVACSAPSGLTTGTLTIDLTDYNSGTGFGNTYGSFTVPLSSMTSNITVFTGTLLTSAFTNGVSTALQVRVYLANAGPLADCLIDRIEVFDTKAPYLAAQVYGSYPGQPEAIDGSATGGIIDTTSENAQPCFGGFVMHDVLYLLKQNSWYSTQSNTNSEPGGWGLSEVSTRVGTCGIHAYHTGEEWCLTACKAGIFGFNGGQPKCVSGEIFNLWNTINWDAGQTIVLRNDIEHKRFYVWVPLPTGVDPATGKPVNALSYQVLPNAPYNPAPTTPNVCLMCNYIGLDSAEELFSEGGVHATMFGTLADVDLRRKWSIWQVPSPYTDFITRQNGQDDPLFVCNGIDSSKIYQFLDTQYSDDGVAINGTYSTYAFVNPAKAAEIPLFGKGRKNYTSCQFAADGSGSLSVTIYPDTLQARFPYRIPSASMVLSDPCQSDFFRPLNISGQRTFVQFSTNEVGAYMRISKLILNGIAHPWSPILPTGGGGQGISS